MISLTEAAVLAVWKAGVHLADAQTLTADPCGPGQVYCPLVAGIPSAPSLTSCLSASPHGLALRDPPSPMIY